MAKLILSEREKKSARYLEWNDAALGKAVKALALDITDHKGEKSLANTACAVMLAAMAAERNEQAMAIELTGVTDRSTEIGDWKIVVTRSAATSKVIGRIPRKR